MGVISGIGGAVNGQHTVHKWAVNVLKTLIPYHASNTKKGTARIAGNGDWNGSFSGLGHSPAQFPGDEFTFTGSIDGTNGVTGAARCESTEIVIDIEGGNPIAFTISFSSNGALTRGAAAVTDSVVPDPPSSIGTKVELGTMVASPVFTELEDVRTVTLTFSKSLPEYASSGTAGETKRVDANLDFTIAIAVYTNDFSTLPDEGDERQCRVFVDATTFWDLKWIRIEELSDLDVDIEAGTPVGAIINAGMHGFANIVGTPTGGYIKDPAIATKWPV